MTRPHPALFAVLSGLAAIVISVAAARPDIGLGLSLMSIASMIYGSIEFRGPPVELRRSRPWYESPPQRAERCQCGRCETCDPLAQRWGAR